MITLLHLGNVLYLVAFSVRDMLWLRIITVVAQFFLIAFYFSLQPPLYGPISWGVLFTLVNLVQIAILILETRPVFLGEEELHLYRTTFSALKPREFVKLLSVAEWKKAQPGDEMLQQNSPVHSLMFVSAGRANVELDGRHVAEVTPGQFVGEMGFLTGQPASARVVVSAPTTYLAWPADRLRAFLQASPAMHLKVQSILGADLVAKLRNEAVSAAHPSRLFDALREAGAE